MWKAVVCPSGAAVEGVRAASAPLRLEPEVEVSEQSKQTAPASPRILTGVPSISIMDAVTTPLRCFGEGHAAQMFADDGVETVTSVEQVKAPLARDANANAC